MLIKNKFKDRFKSIRWKLISTYLTLLFLILFIINLFFYTTLLKNNINDHINFLNIQSNIISNQLSSSIKNFKKNTYSRDYIVSLLKKHSLEINSRILLLDNSGTVIADTNEIYLDKDLNHIKEVSSALEGKIVSEHYKYNNNRFTYVGSPIINDNSIEGVLFISSDSKDIYKTVSSVMQIMLFISIIAVLFTFTISIFFANTISSPIVKLNNKMRKFYGSKSTIIKNRNVDELNELKNSFNVLTTKLKQIESRRKKFVSNVSHELRTPITSIKILSETIINQSTWDEEIYREFMVDINSELNRLNKIINDLLYLADIEKDEIEFNYQLTSLNYLINITLNRLQPLANEKKIKLKFYEKNKIQTVLDRSKFERALINLIGNSIKYTNEGYVEVILEKSKKTSIIRIKDTGVGIDKKDLPFIFDRFYKVDQSRSVNKGSTGLGLSIAQEIIELHDGEIDIESAINIGTEIIVKIPLKK